MTGEHDAGKGDCPRKVDGEKYREHFDEIFRKKEKPCECNSCGNHEGCCKRGDIAGEEGKPD